MSSKQISQAIILLMANGFQGKIKMQWNMRLIIQIVRTILIVFLCSDFLYWVMVMASGHKIPTKTNVIIVVIGVSLFILISALTYLQKRNP